jgi:hypothetical protein
MQWKKEMVRNAKLKDLKKILDCQVASRNPISSNFWEKNGYIEHSKICRKLLEQ